MAQKKVVVDFKAAPRNSSCPLRVQQTNKGKTPNYSQLATGKWNCINYAPTQRSCQHQRRPLQEIPFDFLSHCELEQIVFICAHLPKRFHNAACLMLTAACHTLPHFYGCCTQKRLQCQFVPLAAAVAACPVLVYFWAALIESLLVALVEASAWP